MVQYILNPKGTGRKIKVGGPTYNKLVKDGVITKNGKPAGKKPAGKKPAAGKKALSLEQLQKDCRSNKATKAELISAVADFLVNEVKKASKTELCLFVDQMASKPQPVLAMKKKQAAHMAKVRADTHSNPHACDGMSRPRCKGAYCTKKGAWGCPDDLVTGDYYLEDYGAGWG